MTLTVKQVLALQTSLNNVLGRLNLEAEIGMDMFLNASKVETHRKAAKHQQEQIKSEYELTDEGEVVGYRNKDEMEERIEEEVLQAERDIDLLPLPWSELEGEEIEPVFIQGLLPIIQDLPEKYDPVLEQFDVEDVIDESD